MRCRCWFDLSFQPLMKYRGDWMSGMTNINWRSTPISSMLQREECLEWLGTVSLIQTTVYGNGCRQRMFVRRSDSNQNTHRRTIGRPCRDYTERVEWPGYIGASWLISAETFRILPFNLWSTSDCRGCGINHGNDIWCYLFFVLGSMGWLSYLHLPESGNDSCLSVSSFS